jgi:hypothetical protein
MRWRRSFEVFQVGAGVILLGCLTVFTKTLPSAPSLFHFLIEPSTQPSNGRQAVHVYLLVLELSMNRSDMSESNRVS